MKLISNSKEETQKFASEMALKYKDGEVIFLSGNLGAGKTTFVQGFAKGLGIKEKLVSPTFVLIKQYPLPYNKNANLFHIDLYRLENQEQIKNLGLSDMFKNQGNIILIEWAEKLADLPEKLPLKINFKYLSDSKREIAIIDQLK
jgi:tRNA threonylcarbamoyladenosine biosynthesis protein TsaE